MKIRLQGISKQFPGVLACDEISLEILPGEVHCLLGENGSGKSTLIGILSGLLRPDAGTISIDGVDTVLHTPAETLERGIAVVHQHSMLIPAFTVLENLMLGDQSGFRLRPEHASARLAELSANLGTTVDGASRVADLSLGEQQQVEIIRALWRDPSVLILDEPTSMLPPQTSAALLLSLRRLRDAGIALVFITHKLREALEVADSVTVLRGGRVSGRISSSELHASDSDVLEQRILSAMFDGTENSSASASIPKRIEHLPREVACADDAAPERLRTVGLTTSAVSDEVPIAGIDMLVRAGEILGIAGMSGNGQRHLAEAIAGQRWADGMIILDGTDVSRLGVRDRRRHGLGYVTEDRLREGIVGSMSVALNLVLKQIGRAPFWKWGRLDRKRVAGAAETAIAEYDIRTPSPSTAAGTLSGGNIQKILLARELANAPRVVVFHQPTYGLDRRTVHEVHERIRTFAAAGGSAIIISTDLDELAELAARIGVLVQGRLVGTICNDGPGVVERVGDLMAVGAQTDDVPEAAG